MTCITHALYHSKTASKMPLFHDMGANPKNSRSANNKALVSERSHMVYCTRFNYRPFGCRKSHWSALPRPTEGHTTNGTPAHICVRLHCYLICQKKNVSYITISKHVKNIVTFPCSDFLTKIRWMRLSSK